MRLAMRFGRGVAMILGALTAAAQTPAAAEKPVTAAEAIDFNTLAERAKPLLEQARKGSGTAGLPLSHSQASLTSLAVRTVDGGGEVHKHFSDFLIVVSGEGTEMTGGTMVDPKEGANGEVRGTRLEGAVAHPLHEGVVIHVPAGVPHQQLVLPGKSLVIYVIKVEETNER